MATKYGRPHRTLRKRLEPLVEAGNAVCVRCGGRIVPGEPWDLGHDENGHWHGPEHASCNRRHGGQLGARRLSAGAELGPPGPPTWSRHWYGGFDVRCPDCRAKGAACDAASRFANPQQEEAA